MRSWFGGAAVALAIAACSGGTSSSSPDNPPDAGWGEPAVGDAASSSVPVADSGAVGTGSSSNGDLKIVSLTTTVATLTGGTVRPTEAASAMFVAIVTDVAGLDAIAGGQLEDDAGKTYGAFGAGANKGTYTASVEWTLMNQVAPVSFPGTSGKRTFVAKFFDNAGNVASANVSLSLACRAPLYGLIGACSGECANVAVTGAHCGACGNACPAGEVCVSGSCLPPETATEASSGLRTNCSDRIAVAPPVRCFDACKAAGKTCRAGLYYWEEPGCTGGNSYAPDYPCTTAVSGASFRCKCQ